MSDEYGLSPQQRAFVEHYVVCNNATQAYLNAGYSPKNAGSNASALAKRSAIQRAIEALRPKTVDIEAMVTPEYVLAGLKREAETGETSSGRTAALTQLGRALGMFVDKQATISVSYADELESLQDEIAAAVEQVASKGSVSH